MRITRFSSPDGVIRYGLDRGDGTADCLAKPLFDAEPQPTGQCIPISRRLAPVDPVNIYCIGLNYREHVKESGAEIGPRPVVFMKPTSALNHPGEPIRLPACQHQSEVDYECELAVVIGRTARGVNEASALEYVLGFTAANDVSARWWQKNGGGGQWIRGKGFDSFCPLGPVLVTTDEIPNPQVLTISTTLNDQLMQQSNTSDMIFSVAQLIAFLSQDTTLQPGTVILTGTPQGVGFARKPPIFLKDGDEVAIELENVGKLVNRVKGPEGDVRLAV